MPIGYVDGLLISDSSTSLKAISAGACRSDDNTFNIVTGAITANMATQLDTGAEAADTWYAIWVIGDAVTTNVPRALLSLSATAPTMPSGYDKKRRIGWVRNDSSSDFYDYLTSSTGRDRVYSWLEDIVLVLSAGTATTRTAVDFTEWAPPTCRYITIGVNHSGGGSADFVSLYPDATSFTADLSTIQMRNVPSSTANMERSIGCTTAQLIYYENNNTTQATNLNQVAFTDSI